MGVTNGEPCEYCSHTTLDIRQGDDWLISWCPRCGTIFYGADEYEGTMIQTPTMIEERQQ